MRRAPILLLCTAVLAACADTPRRNVAAYRAPPVEIGAQGAVLAARLPGEFDGWGLDKAMREGVAAYFARHAPGWQVVDAGRAESPDLELTCTTVRDGISNCADLVVTCDTRRPGKPVASSFVRRFESETCFKGGEVENYRAEAYNHGLAVGEEVAADIAELPDLQAIAGRKDRRRMLDEALATRDPEALDAFAAAHPGTEEAERAETIARGWRAAEAETPEDGTSPDAEGDAAAAPETVAAAASDAAPDGAEAPATTAAAEAAAEPPSEPEPAAQPEPDPTEMSCFDHGNNLCGDYSFPTAAKRADFERRCAALGSEVMAGNSCPRPAGAAGCRQGDGTVVTTWVYGMSPSVVAQHCRANGGIPVGG